MDNNANEANNYNNAELLLNLNQSQKENLNMNNNTNKTFMDNIENNANSNKQETNCNENDHEFNSQNSPRSTISSLSKSSVSPGLIINENANSNNQLDLMDNREYSPPISNETFNSSSSVVSTVTAASGAANGASSASHHSGDNKPCARAVVRTTASSVTLHAPHALFT